MLQRIADTGAVRTRKCHGVRIHRRPIRVAGCSVLVSAPAHVRPGVGEHDSIWLELPHETEETGPIVNLALPVWSLAIGAVEPHLGDRAVPGQQLRELITVQIIVFR